MWIPTATLATASRSTARFDAELGGPGGRGGGRAWSGVTRFKSAGPVNARARGERLGHRRFPAPPGQCPSAIDRQAGGASQTSEVEWTVMRDFAHLGHGPGAFQATMRPAGGRRGGNRRVQHAATRFAVRWHPPSPEWANRALRQRFR